MLAIARSLMLERECEDFTLREVVEIGNVSIGSIYFRFATKDELVREVIRQELGEVADEECAALADALANSSTLAEYIPKYVGTYGRILRSHASMLKIAMRKAAGDRELSRLGYKQQVAACSRFHEGLEKYRGQIQGDIESRAKIAFQSIFATISQNLDLKLPSPPEMRVDWDSLLNELSTLIFAYVTAPASSQ